MNVRRIVLSGAPGAGKTTLLHELARRGHKTVQEKARLILRRPGGIALRDHAPDEYAAALLRAERRAFRCTDLQGETVFFDRALGDLASMPIHNRVLKKWVQESACAMRYEGPVLRAPAWREIYNPDEERTQTWDEAQRSDIAVTAAWQTLGYTIVSLPLTCVHKRADFIEALLT